MGSGVKRISMNRQNVIIVDNSVHWTGALRSILNFATFLKDNFEFTLILPAPSSRRSKIEISYRVIPFLELKRNLTVLLYLPMLLINSVRILKLVRNSQARSEERRVGQGDKTAR